MAHELKHAARDMDNRKREHEAEDIDDEAESLAEDIQDAADDLADSVDRMAHTIQKEAHKNVSAARDQRQDALRKDRAAEAEKADTGAVAALSSQPRNFPAVLALALFLAAAALPIFTAVRQRRWVGVAIDLPHGSEYFLRVA